MLNTMMTARKRKTSTSGTKPVQKPPTIMEIVTFVVLSLFKRSLFVNLKYRVLAYLFCLFFVSLLMEMAPNLPNNYFSLSKNAVNVYFVKIAWFWNMVLLTPFVIITSSLISNQYQFPVNSHVVIHHVSRLLVATFFWYFWTSLFLVVENYFGKCVNEKTFGTKSECMKYGNNWSSIDISGHAFILIYGSLVLIEEASVFDGWESIHNHIFHENHARTQNDPKLSTNPLSGLSDIDFERFKSHYVQFKPFVRILFILIALLQLLWDFMLLITVLYYHRMLEKLLAGLVAMATWFITYKLWYKLDFVCPNLPGTDIIKYRLKSCK